MVAGLALFYFAAFPVSRWLVGTGVPCVGPQDNLFGGLPGLDEASAQTLTPSQIGERLVGQYLDRQEAQPRCPAERISGYRVTGLRPLSVPDAGPNLMTLDLHFDVEYPLGVGDWIGWGGTGSGPWVHGKHTHVNVGSRNGRYVITGTGMG